MSKVLIEEQTLYDIGDAIRYVNKFETTYKPSEMPGAITSLLSLVEDIHIGYEGAGNPDSSYGNNGDIYAKCTHAIGTGSRAIYTSNLSGSGSSAQNVLGYAFTAKQDFQITKLALRVQASSNANYTSFFIFKHGDEIIYDTPNGLTLPADSIGTILHELDIPISVVAGEQYSIIGYCDIAGYYASLSSERVYSLTADYITFKHGLYSRISSSDDLYTTQLQTDNDNIYSADIVIPNIDSIILPPGALYYKNNGAWIRYNR